MYHSGPSPREAYEVRADAVALDELAMSAPAWASNTPPSLEP